MNGRLQRMATKFLTAKNAATFFARGPGRFASSEQFWQFASRFSPDLQLDICLLVGLGLCHWPVACIHNSKTRLWPFHTAAIRGADFLVVVPQLGDTTFRLLLLQLVQSCLRFT